MNKFCPYQEKLGRGLPASGLCCKFRLYENNLLVNESISSIFCTFNNEQEALENCPEYKAYVRSEELRKK